MRDKRRFGNGVVTHWSVRGKHQCVTPRDGFFFSRWDEGDQWRCDCGRTWTRWENYAGGGWE